MDRPPSQSKSEEGIKHKMLPNMGIKAGILSPVGHPLVNSFDARLAYICSHTASLVLLALSRTVAIL